MTSMTDHAPFRFPLPSRWQIDGGVHMADGSSTEWPETVCAVDPFGPDVELISLTVTDKLADR